MLSWWNVAVFADVEANLGSILLRLRMRMMMWMRRKRKRMEGGTARIRRARCPTIEGDELGLHSNEDFEVDEYWLWIVNAV